VNFLSAVNFLYAVNFLSAEDFLSSDSIDDRSSFFLPPSDMSICATNTVVFDARKVSLSRRKLADNERWAMMNKKTFQEILNALLAQSTSQPATTATALTFALGQRSASASNKSIAPNDSNMMKGRECDFSGDRWEAKDERTATSSNLESDETLASAGCRADDDDDDDEDDGADDYDLEIKDRCAREASDNLHSLPAASAAAVAGSPYIIGLGGTSQRQFILGQSNLAGFSEHLQGVGIFIVCTMPPSTDKAQYHFADRPPVGATATRNADAPRTEECVPKAHSHDAAATFMRTGSEAVSGVTSESVDRNAFPRFRLDENYETAEKKEEEDLGDDGGSCERIDRPYIQHHDIVFRSALPVRNRSLRLLNGFHPSARSFDVNKASKFCTRRLCCSSAGKASPNSVRRINADLTSKVPAVASEPLISDFAQTRSTPSTEASRTSNSSVSTKTRSTSGNSNAEIRSTNATANASAKHASAELIIGGGTYTAERAQDKNTIISESTSYTGCAVVDIPFSPARVSTSCGGILTEMPPVKNKTNATLLKRTMAPQGAAGLRHSEQSLSLSWSRWMAVDKDVLFCIIEHVLNAEAAAFNSAFCFKTPAPTMKAFSSERRPAATDFEKLPASSWESNHDHLHWATLFRSSQLGCIFEETRRRSCSQSPVEICTSHRQEAEFANRATQSILNSFVDVENNTDDLVRSRDPSRAEERDGNSASVDINRRFAHFRLSRTTVGDKQRHRGTRRRHTAAHRKRKCFQYYAGSGFVDRASEVSSPEREADEAALTDDDINRRGEGISREKSVSSFKWKSKMMMRLRVESHRTIALTSDKESV